MKPGFTTEASAEASLMCRMPGCRNRWAVDVSHGKVCSHHDDVLRRAGGQAPEARTVTAPLPFREAARPFAEPEERNEVGF